MNSYHCFTEGFFQTFQTLCRTHWEFRPIQLAQQYRIPVDHLCEMVLGWAQDHLIDLEAYHPKHGDYRSWEHWQPHDDIFRISINGGYVRVRLRARGGMLAAQSNKHPIGFPVS